ncbi:MAG: C40 family peptidase [Fimbriimonadaceae bacterium]|nr:C40 family peptidase [Alphaproteobacteria bacterium]
MTKPALDRRVNAFRADLAAAHLEGLVPADRYVAGVPRQVVAETAPLRRGPGDEFPLDSELLFGERVMQFETHDKWVWCQSMRDDYVGYVPVSALGGIGQDATHLVTALCSHVYPGPDIKLPPRAGLKMNSPVSVCGTKDRFSVLENEGGYIFSDHLGAADGTGGDFVAIAEMFLGAPYLWGGRSNNGLDCSALVQLSLQATGLSCPRDSDMQAANIGASLDIDAGLKNPQRGDLVFWKGHVGMMMDAGILLHATAHYMMVVKEPLLPAIQRIKDADAGAVTAIRRL